MPTIRFGGGLPRDFQYERVCVCGLTFEFADKPQRIDTRCVTDELHECERPRGASFSGNWAAAWGALRWHNCWHDAGLLAADAEPAALHHPPKAKRVVQLFMSGAASQCDLFDYKPELIQLNGQPFDPGEKVELFQSDPGNCMASPWAWQQYGGCGKWMSDLVPHLATCVDDIAFIHSMVSKSNVHGPATFMQNTGFVLPGFPSMGAWISYGLGSMTDNLPTFVVLPDGRGFRAQRARQLERGLSAGGAPGNAHPPGIAQTRLPTCFRRQRQVHHARERNGGAEPAQAN